MGIVALNQKYFDGGLSEAALNNLVNLEGYGDEVDEFTERSFRFMNEEGFPARDFSDFLGWMYGAFVPRLLPGAWGGMIPPITLAGRHCKLDEYVQDNPWLELPESGTFLDVGCGFPPVTTTETADVLDKWRIVGADPSIPDQIVYDERGDYASFRSDGGIHYFQAGTLDLDRWDELLRDSEATRRRFAALREELLRNDSQPRGEARLDRNPIAEYGRDNLTYMHAGIGEVDIRDVDVARCFNVFIYYDLAFRERALEWFSTILKSGGLFLCGMNQFQSTECRVTVYRNESDGLVGKEFAFSLDNLRPLTFASWYALHEDEHDVRALVKAVQTVRKDSEFIRDFDGRLDELMAEKGIFQRGNDGYLSFHAQDMPAAELEIGVAQVLEQLDQDGFVEGAAEVLRRAGFDSWRNCVGHVGMAPASMTAREA